MQFISSLSNTDPISVLFVCLGGDKVDGDILSLSSASVSSSSSPLLFLLFLSVQFLLSISASIQTLAFF